jgi:hypothetical protein
MRAEQIAKKLGAAHRSGKWWRCVCPVHHSRTGDSATLALRDGDRGLVVFCHAGCQPDAILAELRRRRWLSGPEDRQQRSPVNDDAADRARRISITRRIWDRSHDPRGTPAAAYFLSRGLNISRIRSVHYKPSLRCPDGSYAPALIARVDDVDGTFIGVHRTWLAQDNAGIWRRRDRATLGPIRGGAVRLAPAAETLMVGEGLESCASAMQVTGMPAWAALSTSGLKALILPELVRDVVIVADHDASGAGQSAAWIAAQRWLAEGRSVRIALPPNTGTDFNDMLLDKLAA